MKSDYYEKQAARLDRAEAQAEKNRREFASRMQAFRDTLDPIPPGQPILIGHHSEKRHRAALRRADNHIAKAGEATAKATHYDRKAAAIRATLDGDGAISSDAPDALVRLRQKLSAMENEREQMKRMNAAFRKAGKPAVDDHDGWRKVADLYGCSDNHLIELRRSMACHHWDHMPFPSFKLTNLGANIRRVSKRIADLERAESAPTEAREENGIRIVESTEDNRLQLFFEGKPPQPVRAILKRNGFRWAPSVGAWQRHLNNAARYACKTVLASVKEEA